MKAVYMSPPTSCCCHYFLCHLILIMRPDRILVACCIPPPTTLPTLDRAKGDQNPTSANTPSNASNSGPMRDQIMQVNLHTRNRVAP